MVIFVPILCYNRCPLSYLYINLLSVSAWRLCQPSSKYCDGSEIKINTMVGRGRVAKYDAKGDLIDTCNERAHLIGSYVRVATSSDRVCY